MWSPVLQPPRLLLHIQRLGRLEHFNSFAWRQSAAGGRGCGGGLTGLKRDGVERHGDGEHASRCSSASLSTVQNHQQQQRLMKSSKSLKETASVFSSSSTAAPSQPSSFLTPGPVSVCSCRNQLRLPQECVFTQWIPAPPVEQRGNLLPAAGRDSPQRLGPENNVQYR